MNGDYDDGLVDRQGHFIPPDRRVWLAEYEVTKFETIGGGWPTIIVSKWEANLLGERRFTGESRTYVTPELSRPPERMEP